MADAWPNEQFILVAHSMGNRILRYTDREIPWRRFDRVVMIAADVPEEEHAEAYAGLARETELHVVQNRSDYALVASSLMNGHLRPSRLGQVAKEPMAHAEYHDLSGHVGTAHSYYMDKHAESDGEARGLFEALFR